MERKPNSEIQLDLLSEISDVALVRHLLADLHDDLQGKVTRFKYLFDLGVDLGTYRLLLPGGHVSYRGWLEARSSFINGNYVATVLLCQSLIENVLAAFLQMDLSDKLPRRVRFGQVLGRCHAVGLLSKEEVTEMKKLADIRNPLTHFTNVDEECHLERRSIQTGRAAGEVLGQDAWFAITLAMRTLGKEPFRLS